MAPAFSKKSPRTWTAFRVCPASATRASTVPPGVRSDADPVVSGTAGCWYTQELVEYFSRTTASMASSSSGSSSPASSATSNAAANPAAMRARTSAIPTGRPVHSRTVVVRVDSTAASCALGAPSGVRSTRAISATSRSTRSEAWNSSPPDAWR